MRGLPRALRAWPPAWPSPSGPLGRQRLRGQRHAAGVSRAAGCEAPLRPEGPPRTMRGIPAPCWWLSGDGATNSMLTAWSSRRGAVPGRYGGHRRRPVTGPPGAAARRAEGLPPEGRDESCRTAYGAWPGSDPGRLRRATLASSFSWFARPLLVLHVQAVRPGAPKVRP
jgi:hypothetical protein